MTIHLRTLSVTGSGERSFNLVNRAELETTHSTMKSLPGTSGELQNPAVMVVVGC